jgi:protein TonB
MDKKTQCKKSMYSKFPVFLLVTLISGLILMVSSSVKGHVLYPFKIKTVETDTFPDSSVKSNSISKKDIIPPQTATEPASPPAPVPLQSSVELLTKVEKMPRFYDEGCESFQEIKQKENCARRKFLEYLYENVKYPSQIRRDSLIGDDIVVSRFVVTSDGKIKDIEIIKQPHPAFGKAVIKTLLELNDKKGAWIPGQNQGKTVDVLYTMPVRFKKE